ncbi:MAG: protein kinase [Alphaproteobacteria bacterium]|nr:protein kinase [Alphaproteobacteria bacterium]
MTTDSRLDDHQIRQQLPLPIAAAWHRVMLATGPEARVQRALAAFEIALRCVGGLLVADYLCGEPDPAVEKALEKLARPHLGDWMAVLRETARRAEREDGFLKEAGRAWFRNGKPNAELKAADALVALRNDVQHGRIAPGSAAWTDTAHDAVTGVRAFLGSLQWLRAFRIARVVEQTPTRRRTTRGLVQLYVGSQAQPEPIVAEWDAAMLPDAVYLLDPQAERVLEVSPFFAVLPDPATQEDALFLFRGVHRTGEVVLGADETGSTTRIRPQGERGLVSWADWLASRALRQPLQPNLDVLRTLRAPIRDADRSGEMLADRFEVLGLLGTGGMATVHRVRDHLSDEEAALKILHPELAGDPVFRARFTREAATVRDVSHPNILAHVELGTLPDGELYMRMPLLTGGTVADRVAQGPIPSDLARRWAEQLVSALAHLESLGIVHRDVKPSNLLLDANDDLVLSDFGIALGEEDARLTRTLQQMGSLAYMAPESRGASADVSGKADVYSAALVLHEVLAGEPPAAIPGSGLSGELADVVRVMGAAEPADRPTAAQVKAMLADPSQLPANAPVPSDDALLAVLAAGVMLAAGALFLVPIAFVIPATHLPARAGLPPALGWSAWVVALAMPVLGGLLVSRLARGELLKGAVFVGAAGLGLAWYAIGSHGVHLLADHTLIELTKSGGIGVSDRRLGPLLADPLLVGAWATWPGLWVAGAIGAGLGAVGAIIGSTRRTAPVVPVGPDDQIRLSAAATMLVANAMLVVVVEAAGSTLATAIRKSLVDSDQVGIDVLTGGLGGSMGLTITALVLLPEAMIWASVHRMRHMPEHVPAAAEWRSMARIWAALAFGIPLATAGVLLLVDGSPVKPVLVAVLAGASFVGAAWTWLAPPPERAAPPATPPLVIGVGGAAAMFLALISATLGPVVYGLIAAMIEVVSISALNGTPAPWAVQGAFDMIVRLVAISVGALLLGSTLALPAGFLHEARYARRHLPWLERYRPTFLWSLPALVAVPLGATAFGRVLGRVEPERPETTLPAGLAELSEGRIAAAREAASARDAVEPELTRWLADGLEGTVSDAPPPHPLLAASVQTALQRYTPCTEAGCDLVDATALAWTAAMHPSAESDRATADLLRWRPRLPLGHLLHLEARLATAPASERVAVAEEVVERAEAWSGDHDPWIVAEHAWLLLIADRPLPGWLALRELDEEDWEHPEVAPVALAVALRLDDPDLAARAEGRLAAADLSVEERLSWRGAQRVALARATAGQVEAALAFLEPWTADPVHADAARALAAELAVGPVPLRRAPSFDGSL